jgi:tetratricopeptide (TPR) repeat protein
LSDQGKLDQAIAEYREAIRINPRYSSALLDLGNALNAQGKPDEAIVFYHEVIRIRPDFADPHYNLGVTLNAQGKPDEAIAQYREAIRLRPDYPDAHNNLGLILSSRGLFDQAIAEYRETLRIKPEHASAYCNLGLALGAQGLFRESLESLKRGHELGSRQPGWRDPSAVWVEDARRLVEMEARLPAILKGETSPKDAQERLSLAEMCYKKGLPASSARFYHEAFTEQPTLAIDLAKSHRYNASCAASLAGSGSGKDDPAPDDPAKLKLRAKALGWLKADLTAWEKVLDAGNEPIRKQVVVMTLAHWKEDSDLAPIRDAPALEKLPEAERAAFQDLWRDVEALREKAAKQ